MVAVLLSPITACTPATVMHRMPGAGVSIQHTPRAPFVAVVARGGDCSFVTKVRVCACVSCVPVCLYLRLSVPLLPCSPLCLPAPLPLCLSPSLPLCLSMLMLFLSNHPAVSHV
jgi:hypothetical protein